MHMDIVTCLIEHMRTFLSHDDWVACSDPNADINICFGLWGGVNKQTKTKNQEWPFRDVLTESWQLHCPHIDQKWKCSVEQLEPMNKAAWSGITFQFKWHHLTWWCHQQS